MPQRSKESLKPQSRKAMVISDGLNVYHFLNNDYEHVVFNAMPANMSKAVNTSTA